MKFLAYLDPGTGSFLLQIGAGAVFGGLLFLKRFWRQVKGLFHRKAEPK
jgi:hypothetical protein